MWDGLRVGLKSNSESKGEDAIRGGKAGLIITVVEVVTGSDCGSLATTAANRTRSVPRYTLVTMTVINGGDGLGFVGTEELEYRIG